MSPKTAYFICFSVRGGSSLLCEALRNSGLAGNPEECFHHNMGPDNPQGDAIPDYAAYLRTLTEAHTTPNGVFGLKVEGSQWNNVVQRLHGIEGCAEKSLPQILNRFFPNLRYIWLTRRNKVRQAVSHWMAIQSGSWASPQQASNPTPEYKFEAIDHLLQELIFREAIWEDYFSQYKIKPYVVVYEDYCDQYEETARAILTYLGVDFPPHLQFSQRRLEKQANALSEEWVQRYREEKQVGWWTRFW